MIHRDGVIQFSDIAFEDYSRLADCEVHELQDAHNVNQCDECDAWFDAEPVNDGTITIIEETEFWERFGDVEAF